MAKKLSQEEAKRYLGEVNQETGFWVNNGPVIKSLEELPKSVKKITNEQFTHHVNKEKNDFSNWISDIIGDKALAKGISKIRTKDTMIKKLNSRLKSLKRIAG